MYEPVFHSREMQQAVATARQIASKDVPVLLSGETGTGKEVLAWIIHQSSSRASGSFVAINCAALPKDLIESELFGASKGAYTDSKMDRQGLIEQAQGGTLFLDELNEVPSNVQAKLLRVLQDKEVRRVGAARSAKVNFRLIAAVNVLPQALLNEGKLRPDLYYRINVITINIPPLRLRPTDILPLAETFLRFYTEEQKYVEKVWFGSAAKAFMLSYPWPGNIRQLENEINRMAVLGVKGEITPAAFSSELFVPEILDSTASLTIMEQSERSTIHAALFKCNGNRIATAAMLGIGRQTLYNKMREYALDVPSQRHRRTKLLAGKGDGKPVFA